METGKTAKYFKYAIGEILLVVIGILIALQINNWNEQRKANTFQKKILKEIKTSMEQDLGRTNAILSYRSKIKEQGISDLIENLQTNYPVADSVFRKNFYRAGITLSFYFDKGPFESLKSKGFDYIKNDSVRSKIIRFYEVSLPLGVIFVDYNKDINSLRRKRLRDSLTNHVYKKQDSSWRIQRTLNLNNIKKSNYLQQLLDLEQTASDNYKDRLNSIIGNYQEMILLIENELERLHK